MSSNVNVGSSNFSADDVLSDFFQMDSFSLRRIDSEEAFYLADVYEMQFVMDGKKPYVYVGELPHHGYSVLIIDENTSAIHVFSDEFQ